MVGLGAATRDGFMYQSRKNIAGQRGDSRLRACFLVAHVGRLFLFGGMT